MQMQKEKEIILYSYLNIDNPMVAWEVSIGRIKSAVDTSNNFGVSLWQYLYLKDYADNGYKINFINELLLEQRRQDKYPDEVSRLQGLYFFENEYDAKKYLELIGKSDKEEYISEVKFVPEKISKVDSWWITEYLNSPLGTNKNWMDNYWTGKILKREPLTEILAMGHGVISNYNLRKKAYRKVYQHWPDATPLLAMACCAFQYNESMNDIALVKPAILADGNKIKGSLAIYIEDLNTRQAEIIKAYEYCKKNKILPPYKIPENNNAFFCVPDLSKYNFEFIDVQGIFKKIS